MRRAKEFLASWRSNPLGAPCFLARVTARPPLSTRFAEDSVLPLAMGRTGEGSFVTLGRGVSVPVSTGLPWLVPPLLGRVAGVVFCRVDEGAGMGRERLGAGDTRDGVTCDGVVLLGAVLLGVDLLGVDLLGVDLVGEVLLGVTRLGCVLLGVVRLGCVLGRADGRFAGCEAGRDLGCEAGRDFG